jgi:hypothetical protein
MERRQDTLPEIDRVIIAHIYEYMKISNWMKGYDRSCINTIGNNMLHTQSMASSFPY